MDEPKWFFKSRAFWGIAVMLLATLLGENGVVNIGGITDFLEGMGQTGAVTVGGILALVGTALRSKSIKIW